MVEQDLGQVILGQQCARDCARRLKGVVTGRSATVLVCVLQVKIRVDGLESRLLELGFEAMGRQGRRDGVGRGWEGLRSCHSRRDTPGRYNS
jgi:hypothetical protein